MAGNVTEQVVRTVCLSDALDSRLQSAAFWTGKTVTQLITDIISSGVAAYEPPDRRTAAAASGIVAYDSRPLETTVGASFELSNTMGRNVTVDGLGRWSGIADSQSGPLKLTGES